MDDIVLMLKGAMAAEGMAGLKMNVRLGDKEKVLAFLKKHPRTALNSPTLSPLADSDWLAMEIIIDEDIVRHIMPQLLRGPGTRHRRISDQQDHFVITAA